MSNRRSSFALGGAELIFSLPIATASLLLDNHTYPGPALQARL